MGSIDQFEEIRALAPSVHVVAGDFDYEPDGVASILQLPETRVLQVGHFRIGVIHGHQVLPYCDASLSRMRRKLNVDILISGHTHKQEVLEYDGYYHINPVRDIQFGDGHIALCHVVILMQSVRLWFFLFVLVSYRGPLQELSQLRRKMSNRPLCSWPFKIPKWCASFMS